MIEGDFFIKRPTRCTNFANLFFGMKIYMFRTAFEQNQQVLLESCLQTCMTYASAECTVNKLLTMGRGTARHM